MVQRRRAVRAVTNVRDVSGGHAAGEELALVDPAHVEVGPASRSGNEEALVGVREGGSQLVSDLVAASADTGPQRHAQGGGTAAPFFEPSHHASDDPRRGPAPAGVRRRDPLSMRVHKEHRKAVGRLDPQEDSRFAGAGGVRFRGSVPRRDLERRAVHLPEQEEPSPGSQRFRQALPSFLLGFSTTPAAAETVHEPAHIPEHPHLGVVHHGMLAQYTAFMLQGVLADAREIVEIAEIAAMRERGEIEGRFTPEERRYADSKVDPDRRLAARWAAKKAAARVLGPGVKAQDVEVLRGRGAPRLALSGSALARHRELGGGPIHVSLTHGLAHAAASVVLEGPEA